MTPIPVHFAVDLEPDARLPGTDENSFDNAGVALREMAARRADLEEKTGAKALFGWYLRIDRHVAAIYGDARAIAEQYRHELEARERDGDEIGLHIHSNEKTPDGGWRANYADTALIDETIEESVAQFNDFFGRRARAARMGDGWTSERCMKKLAACGVHFDLTPESGLRAKRMSALYPGTESIGVRPSMLATPLTPFRPEFPDAKTSDAFWVLPLSSSRRTDYFRPGMWLVSARSALETGFRRNRARLVFQPQMAYAPGALRRSLESMFSECERPCICVAVRNFGAAERIHHFLDILCEVARERPIRFVGPAEYVLMATGEAALTDSAAIR